MRWLLSAVDKCALLRSVALPQQQATILMLDLLDRAMQIIYLMQSFSGQGRGVGRSIVHALREGGVSTQVCVLCVLLNAERV